MTLTSRLLVSAAAISALLIVVPAHSQEQSRTYAYEAPSRAPMSFAELIEDVSPSVVSIDASGAPETNEDADLSQLPPQFREFFERFGNGPGPMQPRQRRSSGSGFFISADGYVVTNNHVIEGTDEISVSLSDGRTFEAEIVGTDEWTDLALLKVDIEDNERFDYVKFDRDLDIRVGDWVVAVGNPFGLGGTATAGIVSASGREMGANQAYTDFLQIDAPINRGNSGGPTFDLNGNVVGVNSAIISPTGGNVGIGFAIPSDLAAQVIDQLLDNGEVSRGYLGVQPADISEDMREALDLDEDLEGVLINNVVEGKPADKAGIENGDVVLAVQGKPVRDARDLTRKIGALPPGAKVKFKILRDGKQRNLQAVLAERPSAQELAVQAGDEPSSQSGQDLFGMSFESLDSDDREALDLTVNYGLRVTAVAPDSQAARKDIRPGDVILLASNKEISSFNDFSNAVDEARSKNRSAVSIYVRGQSGQRRYVALRIEDSGDE